MVVQWKMCPKCLIQFENLPFLAAKQIKKSTWHLEGYRNFDCKYLGLDCFVVKNVNLQGIFLRKTKLSYKFEYMVHMQHNHIEASLS